MKRTNDRSIRLTVGLIRPLISAGVVVLGSHALNAQHLWQIQPEDVTIMAGESAQLEVWPSAAQGLNRAYQGQVPDASNDVSDRMAFLAYTILFSTGPLFETTQFWFRGCNDLGCSFTRTATVTVIPAQAAAPPPALNGASDLGEDWWFSDWLGSFNIAFASDGWIFHAQHGWMFVFADSTPESLFFFDLASGGWFWTNAVSYPSLFNFGRNSWAFYFEETSGPRDFVDLVSGEFFSLN